MITLEHKKQLMRRAIALLDRADYLLDEAYKAHCTEQARRDACKH